MSYREWYLRLYEALAETKIVELLKGIHANLKLSFLVSNYPILQLGLEYLLLAYFNLEW